MAGANSGVNLVSCEKSISFNDGGNSPTPILIALRKQAAGFPGNSCRFGGFLAFGPYRRTWPGREDQAGDGVTTVSVNGSGDLNGCHGLGTEGIALGRSEVSVG